MPDDAYIAPNTGTGAVVPFDFGGFFPGMQGQAGFNIQESMGFPSNWGAFSFGGGGGGGMAGGPIGYQNTLTPEQQSILGGGAGALQGLFANRGGYSPWNAFSPEESGNLYNQYFQPQADLEWTNRTRPRIQEAFVGPGTYWSGARGQAEADAAANIEAQKMATIAGMFMQDRASARQSLLPFALGLLNANTGVSYGQPGSRGGSPDMAAMLRAILERAGLAQGGGSPLINGPADTLGWNPQLGGDIYNNMTGVGLGGGGLGGASSLMGFMDQFSPQMPPTPAYDPMLDMFTNPNPWTDFGGEGF